MTVIPHGTEEPPQRRSPGTRVGVLLPEDDVPVVASVGAIGPDKGARRIERLVARMRALELPLRIVVIGYLDVERGPWQSDDARLTVHGRYDAHDLPLLLRHYGVQFVLFPSAGPETFSYTLSETWRAGVPSLVPPIGALAERVAATGAGWVLRDDEWADEVSQPALSSFRDARYFTVNSARGVVFRARVDGARTSPNTKYPRSELREMTDRGERRASWSNKSSSDGVHTLTMEAAITATPPNKPHVVAAQIHDGADDVVMIRLYDHQLVVDANDSKVRLLLDDDYQLGKRFTVSITASNGHIRVVYNGSRAVDYQRSGSGMYFKAGCYTLSNTSYDRADRFGEVVIYKLSVSHT